MPQALAFLLPAVSIYFLLIPGLFRYRKKLRTWYQATGTVQNMIDDGDDSVPVISFTTVTGNTITAAEKNKVIPVLTKEGKTVTVYYNPDNFNEFIASNTTTIRYAKIFCTFLLLLATVFLAIGIIKLAV